MVVEAPTPYRPSCTKTAMWPSTTSILSRSKQPLRLASNRPEQGRALDVDGQFLRDTRTVYYRRDGQGGLEYEPAAPFIWSEIGNVGES